ncbi:alpha/beta fold hydrolase [Streptomyces sanyensis]|uniref:alpha/beta fold hydrolase n=1 Tax=Streptomyces sanyensis TaxID=568869 RepID=UPI003D770CFB
MQVSTGLARLSRNERTQDALLWFVALHAHLAYSASGWVKLTGRQWRSGHALSGIMRTQTFGAERIYRLAVRHPQLSRCTQYAVLGLECLFPLVSCTGGRLTRVFLGATTGFHLVTGFVMGLGRFATAFPAMHPAVAYTSTPRSHRAVAGRDDSTAGATALLVTAAAVGGAALMAYRRLVVLRGRPTSQPVVTRHGNTLAYDVVGKEPGAPVVVFCHNVASTSEDFAWVTEWLTSLTGAEVVTYSRAGYSASIRRARGPYRSPESVDDLEDLVRAVVPADRGVLLVGHALGSELARRAASRLSGRLRGLVYITPAHLTELRSSIHTSAGNSRFGRTLSSTAAWLRLGSGVLLSRPDWLGSLPKASQRSALAQYTDARLWQAAQREWSSIERELTHHSEPVEPVAAPALVITTRQAVDRDPREIPYCEELLRGHEAEHGNNLRVVEGPDHQTLLVDRCHAYEAAKLIAQFIEETGRRGG